MVQVCGLDPSTHMGWAVGQPGGAPAYGLFELSDYGRNEGYGQLQVLSWFRHHIIEHGIERVYWEFPIAYAERVMPFFKQVSIINGIQMACAERDLPCEFVMPPTWRKWFLGFAQGKGEYLKKEAIKVCALRGWITEDHNIAEALGVWDYGCSMADRNYLWTSKIGHRRREILVEDLNVRRKTGGKTFAGFRQRGKV